MSDRRHRSTPPALPEGYQYGDAGNVVGFRDGFYRRADGVPFATADGRLIVNLPHSWRAPHENAAAQLTRQQRTGEETL